MKRHDLLNPVLAAAAALALTPAIAFAAEGSAAHGGGSSEGSVTDLSVVQFISAIIVFIIVFAVLARTAWPKILEGLDAREKKIRSEIFAAEDARKKAAEAQREFERSLAAAKADAQRMIDETRAEQVRLAADLKVKAEAELAQLREAAMRDIEAAKKSAVAEIYADIATLATTAAGSILKRELNANDQRGLVEETMGKVAREYAHS